MVVTRTCFSSLEYNGAEPTLLQSSDGIIFAEMDNISGRGKLSYRKVGIIYIMLLSDLENLLSVWENVLSIANVT